jgi:exodeoxyribonuclease VII small subunit
VTKDINDESTFEDSLRALEDIVSVTESGNISIEEMVKNYQRGVKILANCKNKLECAELKIKEANKPQGSSSKNNA